MSRTAALPVPPAVDLADTDGTVLVVDDDEDLADTYEIWLAEHVTVHTVYTGLEALDTVEDHPIDVVLMDRRMPSLSGDDVLRELRARGHDHPVALVSAVEPTVDVLDLPFDEYRIKPIGRERVHSAVETLLGIRDLPDAAREFVALKATLEVLENGSRYRDDSAATTLADLRRRVASQRERAQNALDDSTGDPLSSTTSNQMPDSH